MSASWALERGVRQRDPPQRALAAEQLRPVPEQPRDAGRRRRQHDDNLDPALSRSGDRARRRRHPARSPAARSSSSALATRRKRDDFDNYIQRDGLIEDGAAVNGGFEQTDARAAQRDASAGSAGPARTCSACRSRPARRPSYNTLDDQVDLFDDRRGRRARSGSTSRSPMRRSRRSAARSTSTSARRSRLRCASTAASITNSPTSQVSGDAQRRPDAEVPQAQPDARLEAGRRLAHPILGPAHGRAAQFLRFHQLRRSRRPTASTAATPIWSRSAPGSSGAPSSIRCSATACSSSTSATTSISMLQDRILICRRSRANVFDAPGQPRHGQRATSPR